ncbi:hypothetical protein [Dishui Lake phycodnavirus 4]|nr:hypothetical protein [Dishui Lake phycodnavirus 4]
MVNIFRIVQLLILLFIVYILVDAQKEKFAEMFGFAGTRNTKSPEYMILNDTLEDLNMYTEVPLKVDQYHFQEIVFACNKYVVEKLDACTYIIETSDIKQYSDTTGRSIIRVMFMLVNTTGFASGLAVTFDVDYETNEVLGARTQPSGINAPTNVDAYTSDGTGQEFINYEIVKQTSQLSKDEFDSVKNKFA